MKILYTATMLSHICQFHLPYLQMLQKRGDEVHVAAYDNLAEKNGLALAYCDEFHPIPFARSPKSPRNIKAYGMLKKLLNREQYDIIVCNTPMGGIVTRLAAKKLRRQGSKVLYMAHGFHFFKGASRKNWMVFYPIERYMARYCDTLITINVEDYALAQEKFRNVEVAHIHGVGVRTERYHPATEDEASSMRAKEGLSPNDFVILCTGELNANKDQATLISAAQKLQQEIPNLRVLLAGNGPLEESLRAQIEATGTQNTVRLLGYRTDLETVVPCVDVIVSCSRREGLPLNIVEAMLCEKPIVAAHNRGHDELICDGENGYLFAPGDADALAGHIISLYRDPGKAEAMGKRSAVLAKPYTVENVKEEMGKLLAFL